MSMDKLSQVESWRMKRKLGQIQCERCHYCWFPRNPNIKPVCCPACKSRLYAEDVGQDFKKKAEVEADEKRRGL